MDPAARRIREAALHRIAASFEDSQTQPESPSHEQRCSADSGAGRSTPDPRALEPDVSPLGGSGDSVLSAATMRLDDAVDSNTDNVPEIPEESAPESSHLVPKESSGPVEEQDSMFLESEAEEPPVPEVFKRPSALKQFKKRPAAEEPETDTNKEKELGTEEGTGKESKKSKTENLEEEEAAPVTKRPASKLAESKKPAKPVGPKKSAKSANKDDKSANKEVKFPNASRSFKDDAGVWQAGSEW